jgi:hypothetical protein
MGMFEGSCFNEINFDATYDDSKKVWDCIEDIPPRDEIKWNPCFNAEQVR